MTTIHRAMLDQLWSTFHRHIGAHGCDLRTDTPGPYLCDEAYQLRSFMIDMDLRCRNKAVPCALCGHGTPPNDRLPYRDDGYAHYECVAREALAVSNRSRATVAVGQRICGATVLALVGGRR